MTTESSTINPEDAVRNLIVCDTQFGWTGETTLNLPALLDLQRRGWLQEGDENDEFDLTDAGRAVVAQALQFAVPATLSTVKPGGTVQLAQPAAFPLAELLAVRNHLHILATTMVPDFCDHTATLQDQIQKLIDDHRRAHSEERS